jgi:hypothetical protein
MHFNFLQEAGSGDYNNIIMKILITGVAGFIGSNLASQVAGKRA